MNIIKDLYIIGAGGFGREVAWLVENINISEPTWKFKEFIDGNVETRNSNVTYANSIVEDVIR